MSYILEFSYDKLELNDQQYKLITDKNYDNKFHVIPRNVIKYFDDKILKLNNLNIVDLDHNELEFLQLKGLLDKELIKPLYLS